MTDSNFDIWRLQAKSDVRGLLDAVRQGTPEIRKRAITALRALSATSAIPALQSILAEEKDAPIRDLLINTLDYLFQQEVDDDDPASEQQSRVVQFIAQLSSDKPEQIIRAAQNLADLNEKIAAESLVVVFHNRQLLPDVRLAAAEALIKLESAPVEITLLAALRHNDWHHRRNAAAVLGQLSADWAIRPLVHALRDEQEIVRRTAYAALKRIGTPDALKAIEPPETGTKSPATETQPAAPVTSVTEPSQPSAVKPEPPPAPQTAPDSETLPHRPVMIEPEKIVPPAAPTAEVAPEKAAEPPPPTTEVTPSAKVETLPVSDATTADSLPKTETGITTVTLQEKPAPAPSLEAHAPVSDEDTQPSAPHVVSDDVS